MFILPTCFLLFLLSYSFAAPYIECIPPWITTANDYTPPDPHGCSLLLSYLPSLPSRFISDDPPIPLSFSLPFLPDANYFSSNCHVQIAPLLHQGSSISNISAPEFIFRLYSAMKVTGLEVVRQCTGENRAGGYATDFLNGFDLEVDVRPGPPDAKWRAMNSPQDYTRLRGPDVYSTLDLPVPIWKV